MTGVGEAHGDPVRAEDAGMRWAPQGHSGSPGTGSEPGERGIRRPGAAYGADGEAVPGDPENRQTLACAGSEPRLPARGDEAGCLVLPAEPIRVGAGPGRRGS